MFLWIIAALLLVSLGIIGYYQGAIRVGFSLIGLLLGAALALPLGSLIARILPVFGLHHPVMLSFLGPAIAYILVLIGFKIAGFSVNRKVDTYYKYKASDTKRMLLERMLQRLGIVLGLANGVVYFFIICVVIYVTGYSTIQFGTDGKDAFVMRTLNTLAENLKETEMVKAIAPFDPGSRKYYTSADILADIYRTPLLQQKLSVYPPFLLLAEREDFKAIGKDEKFQEFWLREPDIAEFRSHAVIKPLVANLDLYHEIMKLVGDDLEDLQVYLATSQSPKYGEEKILGRWKFDFRASVNRAKRTKANMGSAELRYLRALLAKAMGDSVLTATVDNKVFFKSPAGNMEGTWAPAALGNYTITTRVGEGIIIIEGNRLVFPLKDEKLTVVFQRE